MLNLNSNRGKPDRKVRTLLIAAAVSLIPAILQPETVQAQFYYGYRGFRGIPVPVPSLPIAPVPYYSAPIGVAPFGSSVRIRSPYFSLSIGADLQRRVPTPGLGYQYGSYVAPNQYRVLPEMSPSYRVAPTPRSSAQYRSNAVPSQRIYQYSAPSVYSPGVNGGLPEISTRDAMPPSDGSPKSEAFSLARLEFFATTLSNSLGNQGEEGQVWLEYLQPETIARAASAGELTANVESLLQRFEGVTMNPKLARVVGTPGFESTFEQLASWVGQSPMPPAEESVMTPMLDQDREPSVATPPMSIEPRRNDANPNEPAPTDRQDAIIEELPSPLPNPSPSPVPNPPEPVDI